MADYRQYFQAVLRPASDHAVEEFFSLSGRYANFRKETCLLRYLAGAEYGAAWERLQAWQGQHRGYVFVPALERQPGREELERYVALYHQGGCALPFHFENSILQAAFEDSFRTVMELFQKSRGRTEESILRNFAVKLCFWIDRYFPRLFPDTKKIADFPKFACAGTVKLPEYLFLYLLYKMGCDVLYLGQDRDILVEDPALLALSTLVRSPERPSSPPAGASPAVPLAEAQRQPMQGCGAPPVGVPEATAPTANRAGQPLDYIELAKLAASVVMLQVFDDQGQCFKTGSGVMIQESGYILTNLHVVAGGAYYGVLLEEDPEVCYTNELIKYNQDFDLAILRIQKRRAAIPVRRGGEALVRGQKVVAIGSPLGLFNTVSDGIISGFRTIGERSMIQFTAPTSHGSSGGALLDLYGNLIGIITAGFDDGQNLNLAVDCQTILAFCGGLL